MNREVFSHLVIAALLIAAPRGLRAQSVDGGSALAVLQNHCLVCHSSKIRSGRLVMETTEALLRGGGRGPAIVPGKSGDSLLIKMVLGEQTPRMPLEGEISAEEIQILRSWIDAGAPAWESVPIDYSSLAVPDIRPLTPVRAQVSGLAFSPDGRVLAAGGYKEVRLLEPENRTLIKTLTGPSDMVRAVAYSRDGRTLAAAGGGASRYGEVVLWESEDGRILRTLKGHSDYIYDVAFSPDGGILATSSYDRLVKLWDVSTGTELRTLKEHTDAVFPIAFSPDGTRLASGGADRTVKIWDVSSGRRLYTLSDSTDVVFTLAFHPSGEKITASGGDKYIRTWTLAPDGGSLSQAIIAHEAEVTKLLYLGDGRLLATAAADRTVKIWDMTTGEAVRILERQPDWVLDMALTRDGRVLAVGRFDGSIGYYDAADGRPLSPSRGSVERRLAFDAGSAPGR